MAGKRIEDLPVYGSFDADKRKGDIFEVSKNSGTSGAPVYAADDSKQIRLDELADMISAEMNDTSYHLIAISGGILTANVNNKKVKNFYAVAGADFTLDIDNSVEGGQYVLNITKTISGNVVITLPATSSPVTETLIGATNSKFQFLITVDVFDDGAGTPVNIYVVTPLFI